MNFLQPAITASLLGSNIFLQHPALTPSFDFLPLTSGTMFHTNTKLQAKLQFVVYFNIYVFSVKPT
jgi:hypothetical protein